MAAAKPSGQRGTTLGHNQQGNGVQPRSRISQGARPSQRDDACASTEGSQRISSAEVRRRLKALHYGDIEGVELEIVRGKSDTPTLQDQDRVDCSSADSTKLPVSRMKTSTAPTSVPLSQFMQQNTNMASRQNGTAGRNELGARLRMHNARSISQADQTNGMTAMGWTDGQRVNRPARSSQFAEVTTAAMGVKKASQLLMPGNVTALHRAEGGAGGHDEVDGAAAPNWTSHAAHATVQRSLQKSQRLNLVRSRAKQLHTPDGDLFHHGNQETIHLPAGTQAWKESSLVEQRHIDLQLLHITTHGPVEDMTDRVEDQPALQAGALRKVENERAGKNKLQLGWYKLSTLYKSFKRNKEANPFLKHYIKTIQAHYGNGTAAYFIFVRSIIQLNMLMTVLWFAFVVIPTLVNSEFRADASESGTFTMLNLFDGKGPVATSILFFGGYTVPATHQSYHLDMAYLLVTMATIYGSFFIGMHWWANSLTGSSSGAVKRLNQTSAQSYASTVLSSWEHSASHNRRAVANMQAGISTTLKELLDERKRHQKAKKQTKQERYRVYLLRFLAWFIALILAGGAITGLVFLSSASADITAVTNSTAAGNTSSQSMTSSLQSSAGVCSCSCPVVLCGNNTSNGSTSLVSSAMPPTAQPNVATGNQTTSSGAATTQSTGSKTSSSDQIREFGFALSFVAINAVVPLLIELLVLFEFYSSERVEVTVTMIRIVFVRMFNIYALVYTLNTRIVNATTTTLGCGGTYFGQEFYKVIIIESVLQPLAKSALHYAYRYWTNKRMQMNRSQALLGVVYLQALIWTGTPFCPLLPVMGCLAMSLSFFAYYRIVMDTCSPPEKRWTQSLHDPIYIFILVCSVVVIMAPVSIYLTTDRTRMGYVSSSTVRCGPYNYTTPLDTFDQTIKASPSDPGLASQILKWMFSKAVLIPVIAVVMAVSYFMYVRGSQLNRDKATMMLDWNAERHSMRSFLSFISGCKCRVVERDNILRGTAGEYFDQGAVMSSDRPPLQQYRPLVDSQGPTRTSQFRPITQPSIVRSKPPPLRALNLVDDMEEPLIPLINVPEEAVVEEEEETVADLEKSEKPKPLERLLQRLKSSDDK